MIAAEDRLEESQVFVVIMDVFVVIATAVVVVVVFLDDW